MIASAQHNVQVSGAPIPFQETPQAQEDWRDRSDIFISYAYICTHVLTYTNVSTHILLHVCIHTGKHIRIGVPLTEKSKKRWNKFMMATLRADTVSQSRTRFAAPHASASCSSATLSYVHIHTCTCTRAHMYTCTHTETHTDRQTDRQTHTHTFVHLCIIQICIIQTCSSSAISAGGTCRISEKLGLSSPLLATLNV